MFELCHTFKEFISSLHIMILFCILMSRYKHILSLTANSKEMVLYHLLVLDHSEKNALDECLPIQA
jgi:hypothetical protein